MKIFGDFHFTKNYPNDGLDYISEDGHHDVHIMIQSHLTFLDPEYIEQAIYQIINSPT